MIRVELLKTSGEVEIMDAATSDEVFERVAAHFGTIHYDAVPLMDGRVMFYQMPVGTALNRTFGDRSTDVDEGQQVNHEATKLWRETRPTDTHFVVMGDAVVVTE